MDFVSGVNSFLKHLTDNYNNFGGGFLVTIIFQLLGVFLLFGFGLKVLNFSSICKHMNGLSCDSVVKSGPLRNVICAKIDFGGKCGSKMSSFNYSPVKCLNNPCPVATTDDDEHTASGNCDTDAYKATNGYNEKGNDDEDKEFDVVALRKFIKIEKRRADSALLDLEKERMSAAIAAEESMAMILRLQNEKSLIEMEYNQYKRLVEEKLIYDQELIQSLQWLVMKYESERTSMEEQLELSQTNLRLFINSDKTDPCKEEVEESLTFGTTTSHGNIEVEVEGGSKTKSCLLIRSLDLDISPEGFFKQRNSMVA